MELNGAKIAVTGASGFLGRYLVRKLIDRGAKVVGVIRNPDLACGLEAQGVEVRIGDLRDAESLARGFTGVDAVISNAALLSLKPTSWEQYLETNVEGSINVFEAIRSADVARCIQISSVGIYRGHYAPVDEDHPTFGEQDHANRFNAYRLSKALSEETAWRYAKKFDIALTALRPCGIFGANDETFLRWHKRFIRRRWFALYPTIMRIRIVYAGDVAEAAMLALENDASIGKAYNVAGEDRTIWEFGRIWAAHDPRSARRLIPIPVPYKRNYSTERLEHELGWKPTPYEDSIRETLALEAAPQLRA